MLSDLFAFIMAAILIALTMEDRTRRWDTFEAAFIKAISFYALLTLWFPYQSFITPLAIALLIIHEMAQRSGEPLMALRGLRMCLCRRGSVPLSAQEDEGKLTNGVKGDVS